MREPPRPDNFAAQRVHEQLESKVKDKPVPPRSEIVELMVHQALQREEEIDATRAEKASRGLQAAQRKPVLPAREEVKPTNSASTSADEDNGTDFSFFENLLAPGPASNTETRDNDNDEQGNA